MRIAFIGNSHVASLKAGSQLSARSEQAKDHLVFFGSPGNAMRDLEVRDDALQPRSAELARYIRVTSGGFDRIERTYDAYVIVGYLGLNIAADVFVGHRTVEFLSGNQAPISKDALDASIGDGLATVPALQLYKKLRAITTAPVVFTTCPLPSPKICHNDPYGRWSAPHIYYLRDEYHKALRIFSSEHNVPIVKQPATTIYDKCFTKSQYSVEHPEHGLHHMNGQFGKKMLDEIYSVIRRA